MHKTLALLTALPLAAFAAEENYFQDEDWELLCDNTGTCRVAGYHAGIVDNDHFMSLLFEREAGENAAVRGRIGLYADNWPKHGSAPNQGELMVDGKSLGSIALNEERIGSKVNKSNQGYDPAYGSLSAEQTEAVLKALDGGGKITFQADNETWTLSNLGATAALTKMDARQGRVNTPSALIRRGTNKKAVPQATKKPVIRAAAVPTTPPRVLKAGDSEYSALRTLLAQKAGEGCDKLDPANYDDGGPTVDITLYPLDNDNILAEAACLEGTYNESNYYALMSPDLKTFKGEVGDHTTSNAYSGGQIKGYQKGRGAGDCWTGTLYTWDGKTFAKTEDYFTGQCGKEFPGGAWMLYEYTSDTTTP